MAKMQIFESHAW